jgi:hypothetical protein
MRRSVRERKTSKYFLAREYAIGVESDNVEDESNLESEFEEEEEEEQSLEERKSPIKELKRKIDEVENLSSTNLKSQTPIHTNIQKQVKRRRKIPINKSTTLSGSIEYLNKDNLKTSELFDFRTNSDKGYCFETSKFSINNFAVGNYIYFFLKKTYEVEYDLTFKITPSEHKIEVLDKIIHVYPPFTEDLKEDFIEKFIRKKDFKYTSVNAVFSSSGENHLQLIFKDSSNIPFCTLNIESKVCI